MESHFFSLYKSTIHIVDVLNVRKIVTSGCRARWPLRHAVWCTSCKLYVVTTTGDAYRFTMQPVMNIKRQFHCHVRHSQPSVLYTLFYYVQVPSLSTGATTTGAWSPRFQATKIHRTVTSRPGDPGFSQRGRYDVDFLTAAHDTRLELLDDFVLTGLKAGHEEEERWNYSVRASTVRTPPATETSSVHTVSQNVSVVSVQTQRPFSYRSLNLLPCP